MGFLDRLGRLFRPRPQRFDSSFHPFTVRCKRCGELIEGRINIYNDPSVDYGEDGKATYFCRKVVMGAGKCYQQIEVTFRFDEARKKVLERTVSGGEFVDSP
jgi:hypothetical protein